MAIAISRQRRRRRAPSRRPGARTVPECSVRGPSKEEKVLMGGPRGVGPSGHDPPQRIDTNGLLEVDTRGGDQRIEILHDPLVVEEGVACAISNLRPANRLPFIIQGTCGTILPTQTAKIDEAGNVRFRRDQDRGVLLPLIASFLLRPRHELMIIDAGDGPVEGVRISRHQGRAQVA